MNIEINLNSFFETMERNTIKNELTGCWVWQGSVTSKGYGQIHRNSPNITLYVHRLSAVKHLGIKYEADICVLHKCDNPKCWNPDHLFLGTKEDNNRDAASKGKVRNQNYNKLKCDWGHEFTQENTYFIKGHRQCKKCKFNRSKGFIKDIDPEAYNYFYKIQ